MEVIAEVDLSSVNLEAAGSPQPSVLANSISKLRIHVIYCEVEDLASKFYALQEELEKSFPDQLDITGEGTQVDPGAFDVELVGGRMLHSKNNGDGDVDTPERMQAILDGIKEALAKPVEPSARKRTISTNSTGGFSPVLSRQTSVPSKLRIHVTYCDVEDFGPKFFELEEELEKIFPDQLDITGEGTPEQTGAFEVEIVGGKLLHSRNNGDGHVDTPEKLQVLVDAIKEALEKSAESVAVHRKTSISAATSTEAMSSRKASLNSSMIEFGTAGSRKRTISSSSTGGFARQTSVTAAQAMKLRLHVIYCENEDYSAHFFELKDKLEELFPDQLDITGEGNCFEQGCFEVEIIGDKIVHSKNNGDGHVDTPEKLDAISNRIKEVMEKSMETIAIRRASLTVTSTPESRSRKTSAHSSTTELETIPARKRTISTNSTGANNRRTSVSVAQATKLRLHVVYCGSEDYSPQYYELKEKLEDIFPDQLDFTEEETPEASGSFEVEVVGGAVLHSKNNGDGLVDSEEKLQKIVDAIKEAIEHSKENMAARRASLSVASSPYASGKNSVTSSTTELHETNNRQRKRNISIDNIRALHRQTSVPSPAAIISKLRLHVIYCGSEDLSSHFFELKEQLENMFPDQLDITGEETPEASGSFEVELIGGRVLHSRNNGDGLVDTPEKLQPIADGIKEALEKSLEAFIAARRASLSAAPSSEAIRSGGNSRRSSHSNLHRGFHRQTSISSHAAAKLRLHIVYCEVEDYAPHFFELKEKLEILFPDQVDITGDGSSFDHGCFEIEVLGGSGRTLHSKNNGDGLVDTTERMQALVDGIKEELDKAHQVALSRKTSMSSVYSETGLRKRTTSVTSGEHISPIISRQTSVSSSTAAKLRLHVVYCEIEDYAAQFFELKEKLEDMFPDQLDITGEANAFEQGCFEIEIVGQKIIHSKNIGDGLVDTPEKMKTVTDRIQEALDRN